MDFTVLITLISVIVCSKNESINILREIDKNTLNLKVEETVTDVIFTVKSGDYLPLFGSWHAGKICLAYDNLFIRDENIYKWLLKNITDYIALNDFLNNFCSTSFEYKIKKKYLEERNYNFEFRLEIIRKNDFKNILIEYLKNISSAKPSNEHVKGNAFVGVAKNFIEKEITCSFKFDNNFCKMPDFNNYEFIAYERVTDAKNTAIISRKLDSFKNTLIDIGEHALISLAIFGPFVLIINFILAKYFIK